MIIWHMIKLDEMLYEEVVQALLEGRKILRLDNNSNRDLIVDLRRQCQELLAHHTERKITLLKDDNNTSDASSGKEGTETVVPLFGGDKCQVCDFTKSLLEGPGEDDNDNIILLRCCGRCKLTYYCSRKCQKIDRERHQKVCRRKGEFQPGDWAACPDGVKIYDGRTVSSRKHRFVQIMGPTNQHHESQQTPILFTVSDGQGNTAIVPAKNLRNIRPSLWGIPVGFGPEIYR